MYVFYFELYGLLCLQVELFKEFLGCFVKPEVISSANSSLKLKKVGHFQRQPFQTRGHVHGNKGT